MCQLGDDGDNDYWSVTYSVELDATFKALKIGHPEMPLYKRWVQTMFDEIEGSFNSEERWRKLQDNYRLFYSR